MRPLTLILISSFIASGMSLHGQTPASSAEARVIQVSAKKYAFDPSTITVKKGEQVKLAITALDHVHGFKLEAFKIDQLLKK